jgi:hypothetical protein
MSRFSDYSDSALSDYIHEKEAAGLTGRTDASLHEANCEQTDRMSDAELKATVSSREDHGLGADKARAALRARGYNY